ncbi:hypothetical protein LCGC14_2683320 [marine sediment metagenome]|uniref:Uncharacterized protein n=1 Tax=marine sediment metagenome TaxID=412755 RepID=A0A0F8ZKQ6_9ZZZZ
MTLSNQDMEWVKAIAASIVKEVNEKVVLEHIKSCPHGKFLMASKWFVVGICVGGPFAGGSLALVLAKVLLVT